MELRPKMIELPRNAVGLIALLLYLPDAFAAVAIGLVAASLQSVLTWFIVGYSVFIALAFFVTLWCREFLLFDPSVQLRVVESDERLKLWRQAEMLQPDSNVLQIRSTVERLAASCDELDTFQAIELARSQFGQDRPGLAYELFAFILKQTREDNPYYARALANKAYAAHERRAWPEVQELLLRLHAEARCRFRAFHAIALAHAYLQMGDSDACTRWLADARAMPEFKKYLFRVRDNYPALMNHLEEHEKEQVNRMSKNSVASGRPAK